MVRGYRSNRVIPMDRFGHYHQLPEEIRAMIINRMKVRDRCRFSGCSKLENKEAKKSKKYIHSIELVINSMSNIEIDVKFDGCFGATQGYQLLFRNSYDGRKSMNYQINCFARCWTQILEDDTSLVNFAVEKFKNLLKMYQKVVKKVFIYDANNLAEPTDFEITSFANLQHLEVRSRWDILQLLEKVRQPLTCLKVFGDENCVRLSESDLQQIGHEVVAPQKSLTMEQIKKLRAFDMKFHIGTISEMEIFELIETWKNAPKDKRVCKQWRWYLQDSNFKVKDLMIRLGVHNVEKHLVCIQHNIDRNKKALFYQNDTMIIVDTDEKNNWADTDESYDPI